jgi:hypothetical protein
MPKRIIGFIVVCALALFGGASVAVSAAAVPHSSMTAKVAKAKAAANKARAAAAAKAGAGTAARAKAAAEARSRNLAQAGPRAAAAAQAAAAARVRAAAAANAAAQAQVKAAVAARAAGAARAQAAAVAKSGAAPKAKQLAVKSAAAATQAAAKAQALAQTSAAAAVKARAVAAVKAKAAAEARVNNTAQAGPRAVAAAQAAAAARIRAAAAGTTAAQAQVTAAAAARAAGAAQAKATAIATSTASSKVKKKALKAAKAATKMAAKAAAQAAASTAALAKATAAVHSTAETAARTKTDAGPNPLWAPRDSLVFNDPRGSKKQKLAIITQLNQAIDATPAGGEIRMAMYLFDIGSVAKKLIAASRRGVGVQILIDDGESNKYIRKVRKTAGKNTLARSFVATCAHSCMSNHASVMHAKFYLFSVAGKARYVSMISSANPYTGNTYKSWNNNHMIVGDENIYNSLSKYFTDMLADKNNLNYYRVTTSGKYTIYLYPQAIRRPADYVLLNVLDHTSCTTTAPGYGSDGRTLIRVANWGWSGARLDIAEQLWKLHDSGCKVQVMINKGRISRSILHALLKHSKKYGKMGVYNAWYDRNNNDFAELYVHHKTLTINGLLGGRNVKVTWTGSQNFTGPGTRANNDIILRVVDPSVTDAYNRNFAYIRKHYTRRMYTVPWITRLPGND